MMDVQSKVNGWFSGKTALVAGGMGFIGSHLCRRLIQDGARVVCLDNLDAGCGGNERNIEDIRHLMDVRVADVSEFDVVAPLVAGADCLFNLAGKTSHIASLSDPLADLHANCQSQLALLEACRSVRKNIKIVYAGTRQVYGVPMGLPVGESHQLCPVDINGVHKLCGEMYHELYSRLHAMDTTVLRLTNTYGPAMVIKDARQTFLGLWIRSALQGKEISVYGSGGQLRDLNYVDDVVDAFMLAASCGKTRGRIYNLGGSEVLSLNEIAGLLAHTVGGIDILRHEFPSELKAIDIGSYYADFSLIRSELGWEPSVGVKEGILRTVDYFNNNMEHYL